MMELVTRKQKDQELIIDVLEVKNQPKGVRTLNINHVIHAIKGIQQETTPLDHMIITIKTMQIIDGYNHNLTDELEKISNEFYNDFEIGYLIYYYGGTYGYFNCLNEYSLIELLILMNISRVATFRLITSLVVCNDIKTNIEGGGYSIHCGIDVLKIIHRDVIKEMLNESVFIRALMSEDTP